MHPHQLMTIQLQLVSVNVIGIIYVMGKGEDAEVGNKKCGRIHKTGALEKEPEDRPS